jgi:hypothetical protein
MSAKLDLTCNNAALFSALPQAAIIKTATNRMTPMHKSFISHVTGRFDRTGKQHQLGLFICPSGLLKCFVPHIFGFGQHDGNKIAHVIIGGGDVVCSVDTEEDCVLCPTTCKRAVGSTPRNMLMTTTATRPRPPMLPTFTPRETDIPLRSSTLSLCRSPRQRIATS